MLEEALRGIGREWEDGWDEDEERWKRSKRKEEEK